MSRKNTKRYGSPTFSRTSVWRVMSLLMLGAGALSWLGCAAATPGTEVGCISDRDCQSGQFCDLNKPPTSPTADRAAPPTEPTCQALNCQEPTQNPQTKGTCQPKKTTPPPVKDECANDSDCKNPLLQYCGNKTVQNCSSARAPGNQGNDIAACPSQIIKVCLDRPNLVRCDGDEDCKTGEVCQPTGETTPNCPTSANCKRYIPPTGVCVKKTTPPPGRRCTQNSDCHTSQICQYGEPAPEPAPTPSPEPDPVPPTDGGTSDAGGGAPAPPMPDEDDAPPADGGTSDAGAPKMPPQPETPPEPDTPPNPDTPPVRTGYCSPKTCSSDKDCGSGARCVFKNDGNGGGFVPAPCDPNNANCDRPPTTGTCQMNDTCVTYRNDANELCVKCGTDYVKCQKE